MPSVAPAALVGPLQGRSMGEQVQVSSTCPVAASEYFGKTKS